MTPALEPDALRALVARPCPACSGRAYRARAVAGATVRLMDGEPLASPKVAFDGDPPAERVHRVECADCGCVVYAREDCPRCGAEGRLGAALEGRHGLAPPRACPRCGLDELDLVVDLRLHLLTLNGHRHRVRIDAEPHDPGFHVIEARCPDCDETVAAAGELRCAACGRSSLVRR